MSPLHCSCYQHKLINGNTTASRWDILWIYCAILLSLLLIFKPLADISTVRQVSKTMLLNWVKMILSWKWSCGHLQVKAWSMVMWYIGFKVFCWVFYSPCGHFIIDVCVFKVDLSTWWICISPSNCSNQTACVCNKNRANMCSWSVPKK